MVVEKGHWYSIYSLSLLSEIIIAIVLENIHNIYFFKCSRKSENNTSSKVNKIQKSGL